MTIKLFCKGIPTPEIYISYPIVSVFDILDKKKKYEMENCQCGTFEEYPNTNSYCQRWSSRINESYCLLKGGLLSRYCAGATKLERHDIYRTADESICNKSSGKLIE